MIRVDVYLADPAGLLAVGAFGAGALIRVESSADGVTYAELGTVAIDTVTVQPFVYWDSAGTSSTLYRWRVSNSGNTVRSPYSEPRTGVSATETDPGRTYADLGDVLKLFTTKPASTRYPRLAALLLTATDELVRHCHGRDYFRHPASGSESWLADGDGSEILHCHYGLVAVDLVEISLDAGLSFVELDADDWELQGDIPKDSEPIPDGEPAYHVRLRPFHSFIAFPIGTATVRLTGARGWPTIPAQCREGVAERARQLAFSDPSFSGSVPGPPEYNQGVASERWPQTLYRFLADEAQRFACSM